MIKYRNCIKIKNQMQCLSAIITMYDHTQEDKIGGHSAKKVTDEKRGI
jgi:hypothetical protein